MASRKTTLVLVLYLFWELFIVEAAAATTINSTDADDLKINKGRWGFIEWERKALLEFKRGLKDPSGRLISWGVGADCCNWRGVVCDNHTGNVVKLNLRHDCEFSYFGRGLSGEISDSLLGLKHLNHLDLSCNYFQGISIPNFLGSFERLRYLNLSQAEFGGIVPPHIGNLSELRYLDLDGGGYAQMRVSNLNWLSGLPLLKYLDLGRVDLSKAATTNSWVQAVNMLPSLLELYLSGSKLPISDFPNYSNPPFVNLTSLRVLDLSFNNFNTTLPGWLFNISASLRDLYLSSANIGGSIPHVKLQSLRNLMTLDLSANDINGSEAIELVNGLSICCNNSLEELHLGSNKVSGQLPDSLGNLNNLRYLDLSHNRFDGPLPNSIQHLTNLKVLYLSTSSISGPIPTWIGNLSQIKSLDLSFNLMNGIVPNSIGQLRELAELNLDWNSWEGVISEIHFSNLTRLEDFSLHLSPPKKHSLHFQVRPEWIPPFSLTSIDISNCDASPMFPNWLKTQKRLQNIILKNVGISDTIPEWLWKLEIDWLDLSSNRLYGKLPNSLSLRFRALVDLSFNRLVGRLPLWFDLVCLFLRNNLFSGPIPLNIGDLMSLRVLDVSGNSLNGSIPSSMSKLKRLWVIDLSNNNLSGKMPKNWNDLLSLQTLDLSENKLFGGIPSGICSVTSLSFLKLSDNNLSEELSPSLRNCTELDSLDLGNNRFSGEIPKWIGERMTSLKQLRLRGNMFTGDIPKQLCQLSHLHILDLALNNLSGSIPQCFGNFTALALTSVTLLNDMETDDKAHAFHTDRMELVVKGQDMEFENILPIVNLIDLSSNNLRGEIPKGITNLLILGTLNLSRNQLTGKIPLNIGAMQGLETLDLSCNRLLGPIPPNMSSITSLNHLNLSHNLLSGPIPTTNQFSTFNDPSIYEENLGLCGLPLSANCCTPNDQNHQNDQDKEKDDEDEDEDEDDRYMTWFFISMGLGFPVGFWAVCGTLALNKSWRHAYFRFIDRTRDRLYVSIVVNMARLKKKMEKNGVHG